MTAMVHPLLGEVELVPSLRARRIIIRVLASGAVRVTVPRGVAQRRALAFLDEKAAWVERTRARLAAKQRVLPAALTPAEAGARTEALRREAHRDLPPRIERLAAQTGLRYEALTIRAARTKWGSCSTRNRISLSLYLMALPEHLRDFVILHELCHTVHHNHGAGFHALLDGLCGGREKALDRELRAFSIR